MRARTRHIQGKKKIPTSIPSNRSLPFLKIDFIHSRFNISKYKLSSSNLKLLASKDHCYIPKSKQWLGNTEGWWTGNTPETSWDLQSKVLQTSLQKLSNQTDWQEVKHPVQITHKGPKDKKSLEVSLYNLSLHQKVQFNKYKIRMSHKWI